eukprot:8099565-Alexandrium_andersonii.AAC.1
MLAVSWALAFLEDSEFFRVLTFRFLWFGVGTGTNDADAEGDWFGARTGANDAFGPALTLDFLGVREGVLGEEACGEET